MLCPEWVWILHRENLSLVITFSFVKLIYDVYILVIHMIVNLPYCSRIPGMRNKAAERSNTIKAVDV